MQQGPIILVVLVQGLYLIIGGPGVPIVDLGVLLLLLRARLLVMVRVRALVRVSMPGMGLVAGEALLVLRLLNQVIDDVLVILQLVELVLLEVDRDGLVVSVVVVEKVSWRCPRLVGLKTCVDGEAVHAQVY